VTTTTRKCQSFFAFILFASGSLVLSTILPMPEGQLYRTLVNDDTFRRLCRARDLLAAQYQSQIFLETAARQACLSPFHFHRLFRATFGETPHDFITRRRMDHARRLLASGEMTVTRFALKSVIPAWGISVLNFKA